jgi:cell division protein FtsW (lipid II flippase)
MIAVQWGLIGLGLFLYLLFFLWRTANRLEKSQKLMAQGLVITIIVGCLVNSFLIGVFYAEYNSDY